jgi:peptidyl-prolyl cis-trans isomerase SurA
MKHIFLIVLSFFSFCAANAQNDPTIMTINGKPVSRSEFEYSYNKNNTAQTIDRKTVDEYVDMFINYKLKVEAAKDEKLDTMTSFKKEFASYRDEQIRPSVLDNDDLEREAHKVYEKTRREIDSTGGLIKPAHILIYLNQNASKKEEAAAKQHIDSIYNVLRKGADFAEMAKKYSGDEGSAANGGELPWVQHGRTLKEFEDVAFSLKKGEMSKPFLSPVGYHIILMKDRRMFFPYDSLHTDLLRYLEQRGLRQQMIDDKLDSLAKKEGNGATKVSVLAEKQKELEAKDSNLKYLIQEYHDGLLVYNISKDQVWDKASNDEVGLESFFKKNKKRYAWTSPRFKGIYYCTKDSADIDAVQKAVKGLDFEKWGEKLRTTFNKDSVLRIKVEKGVFKKGDNAYVDKVIFGTDTVAKIDKQFPFCSVYGKKLKKPQNYRDVRGVVISDYQESLEKQWVDSLRKKYSFTVNKDILATVNKH